MSTRWLTVFVPLLIHLRFFPGANLVGINVATFTNMCHSYRAISANRVAFPGDLYMSPVGGLINGGH